MARRRLLVGLTLALFPVLVFAQEAPRTLTQMIVGGGPFAAGTSTQTPVYTVGFEIRPAGSRVSWRLLTEFWESSYHRCFQNPCDEFSYSSGDSWGNSQAFGIQALGVRTFGTHRFQPYLLGGAGLYSRRARGYFSQVISTSPFVFGSPIRYDDSEVTPTLIWGAGLNARVFKMNLFGDMKLPLWTGRGSGLKMGPQSPLIFGFRF